MKIIAIIPARGGSKGIPGKNVMDFCGKPLIAWSIEYALASKYIKNVYVTTEDKEIADVSKKYGANIIQRPAELATDTSSADDALMHALGKILEQKEIDIVVFLQPTSPVREIDDIDNSLDLFLSEGADSLFSATMLDDICLWKDKENRLQSITYDYLNRGRRQDRKPYYLENGSIYIFKPDVLTKFRNRLGGSIVTYLMPKWKSFEIDSLEDIEICRFYMQNKIIGKQHVSLCEKDIRLLVYDFDGIFTNNKVLLSEDGLESVTVNRSDGLAVEILRNRGLMQIILSKETNKVVNTRAKKLDISVIQGADDKEAVLKDFCRKNDIALNEVVYVGNDINDLKAMSIVGYPVCPSDASEEVKRIAKIILDVRGGEGVARELLYYLVPKCELT